MSLLLQSPHLLDLFTNIHDVATRSQQQQGVSGWPSRIDAFSPAVDVTECDKAYAIIVELPGFKKENIRIQHKDFAIIISGEISDTYTSEDKKETGTPKFTRLIRERSFGAFQRKIRLGPHADFGTITATFEDGLLKVSIAKKSLDEGWKSITIL